MNNNNIDITHLITNPVIFIQNNNPNPPILPTHIQRIPMLHLYIDNHYPQQVRGVVTAQAWRLTFTIIAHFLYEVRRKRYIVTAETFDQENMFFAGSQGYVKFRTIVGRPVTANDFTDFSAFADFIELCFNLDPSNPAPTQDIIEFVGQLRRTTRYNTPIDKRHLILGNFALMKDSMRRHFLMRVWDSRSKIRTVVRDACSNLDEYANWITAIRNYPPTLRAVFDHYPETYDRTDMYPENLAKFLRHCMSHLKDNQYYSLEETVNVMTVCLPNIVLRFQSFIDRAEGYYDFSELQTSTN